MYQYLLQHDTWVEEIDAEPRNTFHRHSAVKSSAWMEKICGYASRTISVPVTMKGNQRPINWQITTSESYLINYLVISLGVTPNSSLKYLEKRRGELKPT